MNKNRLSFKDEAHRALSRGEWRKALEHFQKHCAEQPEDIRSRLKVAELLERLGQKKEAVQAYRKVGEAYAKQGFLLQAISINKMILRIYPSSRDVHDRLVQLYAEKIREMDPLRPFLPIPFFSELNEQELQSLLPHIQSKTFMKNALICQEGERGDSLFVISRGEVAITKQMPEGNEVRVCNLKEGDFFGEFGFFMDQKRHATVKAVTESSDVLEIHRDELSEIIKRHPHIKEVLQNLFRQRVLDLFLACSPLFSSLTPGEREKMFKRFRLHKVPGKTMVFRGGDPSDSLFMIKSGEVEIYLQDRHGKRVTLGVLRSGNFFGEIGVLLNRPRMAFARTGQPSELLELTKKGLETCSLQSPKLRSAWKEISYKRLTRMKELLSQKEIEKVKEAMV
jgi:cAMP-dependent protein kinase regulator